MKKKNQIIKQNNFTDFLLYTTPNGNVKVEIFLKNENIWLTQEKIAVLFGVQRPAITKHLKNIFESGELKEISVSSILEHTAKDGKIYNTKFYNFEREWNRGWYDDKDNLRKKVRKEFKAYANLGDIKIYVGDDSKEKNLNKIIKKYENI